MSPTIRLDVSPREFLAILHAIGSRLRELADSEAKEASREEDELQSLEKRLLSQRTKASVC